MIQQNYWYAIQRHDDDGIWYELQEVYTDGYKVTVALGRDYAQICRLYDKANAIQTLGLVGVSLWT